MSRLPTHASFLPVNNPITISGGGLTGLSLAIGLRRHGVPVSLHEAGTYPRHRVCGEFISGVSPATLQAIGIEDCLADAHRHHHFSWFAGDRILRSGKLKEPALAISRYRLDRRLCERALELGAKIETSSRLTIQPHQAGFVRASGRVPAQGKWLGLKGHFRGLKPRSDLEMHTGARAYLGITPVEDGWYNVCGLFEVDRNLDAKHEQLLIEHLHQNGNHQLAETLAEAQWREGSFCAVAGFDLGRQIPTPGILSLGDSHAIIPPFTGNGMSMAFQSVETALPDLVAYARGEIQWQDALERIEARLRRLFRKRLTASRWLHPWLFRSATRQLLKHAPIKPMLSLIR